MISPCNFRQFGLWQSCGALANAPRSGAAASLRRRGVPGGKFTSGIENPLPLSPTLWRSHQARSSV